MRRIIAILAGRFVSFAGKFVGRASNLPGQIALKICPDFLKHFTFKGKVIAITGSNGKTTTTNMIAHVLRENGYKVVCNKEGANLTPGIATTLLNNCTMSGYVDADFTVLEVDERFARFIFKYFSPDIFTLTNLVRDQLYRNGNPDLVMDKVNEAISPSVKLVLNGNDPISMELAPDNIRVYYGMGKTSLSQLTNDYITHDAKVCPRCFNPLDYSYYHYNHIGGFSCSSCQFKTPELKYENSHVDFETGEATINGTVFKSNHNMPYHYLNVTAVVATCMEAGLDISQCKKPLDSFIMDKERLDSFQVNGRKAICLLSKQNSVSMDQSINFTLSQKGDKTVVFMVNNAYYIDKKDISWIYDTTFEKLIGQVDSIICSGSRAYDVAIRLELGGFDMSKVHVDTKLENLKDVLKSTKGDIYLLAGTAFGGDDGLLEILKSK